MPDDPTEEEMKIIDFAVLELYRMLESPVDKFIVAMVYELGYGKDETAVALDITYDELHKQEAKIREKLANFYKIKV